MDDIFAIQMLKARYFRCIDTKDWAAFAAVFTEDVEIAVREDTGTDEVLVGRDRFARTVGLALDGATTVHPGHMPEIEVAGDGTATGTWAMEDYVEWAPGEDGARQGFRGYGHYHETYRHDGDRWRIATLRLTRLRRDQLSPGGQAGS